MATGWAKEGAVQEQIDNTVQDGVDLARSRLGQAGDARTHCEECGEGIPAGRRAAIKGVRLCVTCQAEEDERRANMPGFNRRGSKDSQLR